MMPMDMTPPTPPGFPPPMQQQFPQAPPPAKKSNVLLWVLLGIGGLVLMVVLAVGVGGFFVYRTVKKAGFDPDLMRSNPGLAMAKMATAFNPDAEVVSTNDRTGTVVIREKSTGKITTMKFDPDKKSLAIVGDDGNEVRFNASGGSKNGSVEVQGQDGAVKFGTAAGNATPAWLPVYPGSAPQGTLSTQTPEGSQNTYTFKTQDAPAKVIAYFQDQLKGAGFAVTLVSSGDQGGMVQAEDSAKNRNVLITAGASSGGTTGSITAIEKK
jgi:hypothetical protein